MLALAREAAVCYASKNWSHMDCWKMDLGLDIRTAGRPARDVAVEYSRDLTAEDAEATTLPRASQPKPLTRLKNRHHALARYLAAGMADTHAAIICGYDISRISILKADPTFAELVAFYAERQSQAFDNLGDKLSQVANEATQELIERLEESPEKLTVPQLMELAKLGADRTGYGPQSKMESFSVTANLHDDLEAARRRVKERRGKVIDAGPSD